MSDLIHIDRQQDRKLYYLVNHLVKIISLPDFIERETDRQLVWTRSQLSARCHCPLPNHNDRNASFTVTKMPSNDWVFNCFGCNAKGNIVHFCMEYYGLRNKLESILFLCKKFDIKDKEDLILQGIKNISKTVDVQRKMENANILVSNQCRMLLRSDFEKHKKWVAHTYKLLDHALEREDYEAIDKMGYEASNRITGVINE